MQHGGDEQAKVAEAEAFTCSFLRRPLLDKSKIRQQKGDLSS
ncbi:hypothetical protein ABEX29_08260 [Brevibacillus porteri]